MHGGVRGRGSNPPTYSIAKEQKINTEELKEIIRLIEHDKR